MNLSNPIYTHEDAARKHLENIRWSNGMFCSCCGSVEKIEETPMKNKPIVKNPDPQSIKGYYHCGSCRKKFTVRTGTIYERSHVLLFMARIFQDCTASGTSFATVRRPKRQKTSGRTVRSSRVLVNIPLKMTTATVQASANHSASLFSSSFRMRV